jgi:hypothetical protein
VKSAPVISQRLTARNAAPPAKKGPTGPSDGPNGPFEVFGVLCSGFDGGKISAVNENRIAAYSAKFTLGKSIRRVLCKFRGPENWIAASENGIAADSVPSQWPNFLPRPILQFFGARKFSSGERKQDRRVLRKIKPDKNLAAIFAANFLWTKTVRRCPVRIF